MTEDEILDVALARVQHQTNRVFVWLLLAQWPVAIAVALAITPFAYAGPEHQLHLHVKLALASGPLIDTIPLLLVAYRPRSPWTRHAVAAAQMGWSATLIMLSGGRIETHFHVFVSLAFLAFYRDWKVLITAALVVVTDHLVRGLWFPDSVYGSSNPEWWRFVEHASWVAFENIVLWSGCRRAIREMRATAQHEARLARTTQIVEDRVQERTRELATSNARYRMLVENTAAIPFEMDLRSHRVIYIAPRAAELLECELAELDDAEFMYARLVDSDRARVRKAFAAFAGGEAPANVPIEFHLRTKAGAPVEVRALMSTRSSEGCIGGMLFDVTREKQLENELRQAQKLESVGRLAAGVAHEINTPIQFVGDSVQFARDAIGELVANNERYRLAVARLEAGDAVDLAAVARAAEDADIPYIVEHVPQALERALDGTERVSEIVRSMKVFAHTDRGAAPVDLVEAIKSTVTISRSEYKYVADVELDLQPLPLVTCVAGEINQTLLNIIVNASHAIAATGTRGTIAIRTRDDGDHAVIQIADTGGGIPDTIRDRIFDPFFTTKPVGKGTGQGLAIARSVIVDKHRGTLAFRNVDGGATFEIRIPYAGIASSRAA